MASTNHIVFTMEVVSSKQVVSILLHSSRMVKCYADMLMLLIQKETLICNKCHHNKRARQRSMKII